MNKVKFKSPTGKVVSVKVTQNIGSLLHSKHQPKASRLLPETSRYMMKQGFTRAS